MLCECSEHQLKLLGLSGSAVGPLVAWGVRTSKQGHTDCWCPRQSYPEAVPWPHQGCMPVLYCCCACTVVGTLDHVYDGLLLRRGGTAPCKCRSIDETKLPRYRLSRSWGPVLKGNY